MSYTGLELFMEKLKQMVFCDYYPLISNHLPSISPVRPQLQRLYEELHSTIQLLYAEKQNHLQECEGSVTNLKKRFKEVAEEAHDRVDLFVSVLNFKHEIVFPNRCDDLELSLNLRDIIGSIKSIKKELDSMNMDSSLKRRSQAAAGASCIRSHSLELIKRCEIVVGLADDIRLIMDKLVEYQERLHVVSIVGAGGIGKTTLAIKVFNHPYVKYYFVLRAWVTVSQKYDKRDVLIRILASLGIKVETEKSTNFKLREMLHKHLMHRRYLIVIDDVWSTEDWDDLKVFFPNDNTDSRILLTSRLKEVALHAKPYSLIHQLEYLTDEESWELLCKKVFCGYDCPESLRKPGMQIAKGCRGLPLALVVIAGVLAQEARSINSWERIAQNATSYEFTDPSRYIDNTLALSVNHLPFHLRDCFLYLGGFPEDYKFRTRRLICLWVAEGFIQAAGNQSLEEIAEGYLLELVDRNLVGVNSRKFNGAIKTFSVHDVLRELCIEIATKENAFFKKQGCDNFRVATYKTRRIFTDCFIDINNATRIRSLLYFHTGSMDDISRCFNSWMLLTVLDLQEYRWNAVEISLLVHLRYLAIQFNYGNELPFTICNLRSLQTLIIRRLISHKPFLLPNTISNLVSLRNLWIQGDINFPQIQKPMNLQRISNIFALGDGPKSWVKYFPKVKKLSCFIYPNMKYDFKSLDCLEILTISSSVVAGISIFKEKSIMLPVSLKKLTLKGCHLPWSCMSKVQALPKLEVLILLEDAFVGPYWDVGEEPFQKLKFLKLDGLDIKQWKASSTNFPCLKQLFLKECHDLEELPLEIGYISTLERIEIEQCQRSVAKSVRLIQKEQHADGNFDTEIIFDELNYPYPSFFNHPPFFSPWDFTYQLTKLIKTRNDLKFYLPEAFNVPINRPPVSQACHHMHNSRRWNDQRSKRRPIWKFSNKDGGLRLLQY